MNITNIILSAAIAMSIVLLPAGTMAYALLSPWIVARH